MYVWLIVKVCYGNNERELIVTVCYGSGLSHIPSGRHYNVTVSRGQVEPEAGGMERGGRERRRKRSARGREGERERERVREGGRSDVRRLNRG